MTRVLLTFPDGDYCAGLFLGLLVFFIGDKVIAADQRRAGVLLATVVFLALVALPIACVKPINGRCMAQTS